MKKLLIICMAIAPAIADAKVCVPEPSGGTSKTIFGNAWQSKINKSGIGDFIINGIGWCSSTSGTLGNKGTPSISEEYGKHCWCKMTSPREGPWVYGQGHADSNDCRSYCWSHCSRFSTGITYPSFRTNILSQI